MEGWWRYCAEGLLWVCGRSAFCWHSFRRLGWVMCRYSVSWLLGIADGLTQKCRPSAVDRPGLLFSRTYKPYLVGLALVCSAFLALFCSALLFFALFCSVLPCLALLCLCFCFCFCFCFTFTLPWYALACSALVWPGLLCFVCLDSSFSCLSFPFLPFPCLFSLLLIARTWGRSWRGLFRRSSLLGQSAFGRQPLRAWTSLGAILVLAWPISERSLILAQTVFVHMPYSMPQWGSAETKDPAGMLRFRRPRPQVSVLGVCKNNFCQNRPKDWPDDHKSSCASSLPHISTDSC